ncbi:MAG TPA: hypothetical protein VER11_31670 [Polyangiaceae bacterium]|nr:hypothetical protein [Polyangiaceae bacterium]
MNELEHDGVASEPTPAKTHDTEVLQNRPIAPRDTEVAPSSDSTSAAAPSDETELEPTPVWDDPSEPLPSDSEQPEDPWAFLEHLAEEPIAAGASERRPKPDVVLERALIQGLFRVNLEQFLAGVERALRSKTRREDPVPALLRLVSRARVAGATEPRLIEAVLRAHSAGQRAADLSLLSALLARRLALPSLRAERCSVESSSKQRLLRETEALVSRVSRSHGERGLRELVRLSGRIGTSAGERGCSLTDLAPLLARRFERDGAARAGSSFESESRGSRRTRRIRLPGRVEIVIYEE